MHTRNKRDHMLLKRPSLVCRCFRQQVRQTPSHVSANQNPESRSGESMAAFQAYICWQSLRTAQCATTAVALNLYSRLRKVLRWSPSSCCFFPSPAVRVRLVPLRLWRTRTARSSASCLRASAFWPGSPFAPSLIPCRIVCSAARCRVERWVLLGRTWLPG